MVIRDGGDNDEGVDLFQDALSIVYQKAGEESFEVQCSMEAYIFGICRKLWLMRLRRKGVERKYMEHEMAVATEDSSLEGALGHVQKELVYENGFGRLGERCQKLLRLFYQKKTFREIASLLNLSSEGYAKKLKFQCKQQLIDEIRKDPLYIELIQK